MIPGVKDTVDPYASPCQLRQDYLRTGALMGGLGEGVWGPLCEMLVDGVPIPVEFTYGPPAGETWVLEDVTFHYAYPHGGTPVEFGAIGNPLARPFYLQIWNGDAVASMAVVGILTNGDFLKFGAPFITSAGIAVDSIIVTWTPPERILLRGNLFEFLWVSINSDLTVAGAGVTLSAQARAYKQVG